MIEYRYGCPPRDPYDYKSFVCHLAPHLPKNDAVFFHNESLEWRNNQQTIPLALFKNICHWKSRRPFRRVCSNRPEQIKRQWREALYALGDPPYEDGPIERAINELVTLSGVRERTASALLTAWNPDEFAIMDIRVFEVLGMGKEYRNYTAEDYVNFRERLLTLKAESPDLEGCSLRQIEMALWHFYPMRDYDVRKRPAT